MRPGKKIFKTLDKAIGQSLPDLRLARARHRFSPQKEKQHGNEKTDIGEAKPKFQQPEPQEISDADLQGEAGGSTTGAGAGKTRFNE